MAGGVSLTETPSNLRNSCDSALIICGSSALFLSASMLTRIFGVSADKLHANEQIRTLATNPVIAFILIDAMLAGSSAIRQSKTCVDLRLRPGGFRELWLMKFKLFKSINAAALEGMINEWLQEEGVDEIKHVTHASDGTSVYITVWWIKAR